jgi:hypothetical protein
MAELEWVRSVLIFLTVGGGGAGLFKLVRLFQRDFLGPYRNEMIGLRERIEALEGRVERAERSESQAWNAVAVLRRALNLHGIVVPPLPGEPDYFAPLPPSAHPPTTGPPDAPT